MSTLDISCQNSLVFTNNFCDNREKDICIGDFGRYSYWSTLYFDLSSIPQCIMLQSAKIVLFKIPIHSEYNPYECKEESKNNHYKVSPLSEFASPYTYYYTNLKVDESLQESFEVLEKESYTQIDITGILKAWLNGEIENKGVLLEGEFDSKWILYGSEFNSNNAIHPFLRVQYEQPNLPYPSVLEPIVKLPTTIEIKKNSFQ